MEKLDKLNSLEKDTLELLKKAMNDGALTNKDLAQINSIVIRRLESVKNADN